MLGLVCLAWLYLRKLKTRRGGGSLRSPAQCYGSGAAPAEARTLGIEPTSRFT
jgi:hypothetical protein